MRVVFPHANPTLDKVIDHNSGLLKITIPELLQDLREYYRLPFIRSDFKVRPRIMVVAGGFLKQFTCSFDLTSLSRYTDEQASLIGLLNAFEARMLLSALRLQLILDFYDRLCSLIEHTDISQCDVDGWLRLMVFLRAFGVEEVAESVLRYEDLLKQDPAGVYHLLDAPSKWAYRLAVDELGSAFRCGPKEVVRAALELSTKNSHDLEARFYRGHVGYYLVDEGRRELVGLLGPSRQWSPRSARRVHSMLRYLLWLTGTNLIFALGCSVVLLGQTSWEKITTLLPFALVLVSEGVNRLLDFCYMQITTPRVLPALNYSAVPPSYKTLVCVPSVLFSADHATRLLKVLESHRSCAPSTNVHFALLTEFGDGDSADTDAHEQEILNRCTAGIRALNSRYGECFYLLHRTRVFSNTQQKWIGWERKRGKFLMLNRLILRGLNSFSETVGNISALSEMKLVVLLDDNSTIGENSLSRLIGMLAHPLNRAVIHGHRLIRGFTIIQPFPCVTTDSARIFGWTTPLVEPLCPTQTAYTRNVHFDLFGRSGFYGKGIYEIASFDRLIGNRLPEERVLSHDTLEAGLANTAYDGFATISEHAPQGLKQLYQRSHRWVRGDWQNLILLLSQTRMAAFPSLTYYSVVHFVCRSLISCLRPSIFIAVALCSSALSLRILVLYWIIVLLPDCLSLTMVAIRAWLSGQLMRRLAEIARSAVTAHQRELVNVSIAPQIAIVTVDAILRALYRICRKRNMLSWKTGSYIEASGSTLTLIDVYVLGSMLLSVYLTYSVIQHRHFVALLIPFVWIVGGWTYWQTSWSRITSQR